MWYYRQTERRLWTVGHGEGENWQPDSDHDTQESAANRCAYLNGSDEGLKSYIEKLEKQVEMMSGYMEELEDKLRTLDPPAAFDYEISALKMTIAVLEQNQLPADHMERAEYESRLACGL